MLGSHLQHLWKALKFAGNPPTVHEGEKVELVLGDCTIFCLEKEQKVSLFATLLPLDGGPSPALLEHFMEANCYGLGCNGCVLGLDEDSRTALLSKELGSCSYQVFFATLEDFANECEFWKGQIPTLQAQTDTGSPFL